MTDQERILNRVKKMLNLANDAGATEGERDNALRMAYATLQKHNIELAAVEAHTIGGKKQDDAPREQVVKEYVIHHWARVVSMAIAELFFCHYHYRLHRDQSVDHVFTGRAANAVTAADMAEYICKSIARESRARTRGSYSPGQAQRDFAKGAVTKICRRCYDMRHEAEAASAPTAAGPRTALVLASFYKKEEEANRMFLVERGLGKLKAGPGSRAASNGAAYISGLAYGSTVSLDRQIKGGGA